SAEQRNQRQACQRSARSARSPENQAERERAKGGCGGTERGDTARGAGSHGASAGNQARSARTEYAEFSGPGIGGRGSQRASEGRAERILSGFGANSTVQRRAERGHAAIGGNLGEVAPGAFTKFIRGSLCFFFFTQV